MEEYSGYVGLDVHKETISPALAYPASVNHILPPSLIVADCRDANDDAVTATRTQ